MVPKRKWGLSRSSIYGLVFQIMVLWLSDRAWGADEWGRVTFDMDSGTWQGMTTAISALLPGPCLFVTGAWLRNSLVERAVKASRDGPKTLDFQYAKPSRQAQPLSTAVFTLALTFSIVVLAGPLVASQIEQFLQAQPSTPSVMLASPTPGGAIALSPALRSGLPMESGHSTGSGSPPLAIVVQKGRIKLSGSSPVMVTFAEPFGDTPEVTIVNVHGYPASAVPTVEDTTPNSFMVGRAANNTRTKHSDTEFEWIARGISRQ